MTGLEPRPFTATLSVTTPLRRTGGQHVMRQACRHARMHACMHACMQAGRQQASLPQVARQRSWAGRLAGRELSQRLLGNRTTARREQEGSGLCGRRSPEVAAAHEGLDRLGCPRLQAVARHELVGGERYDGEPPRSILFHEECKVLHSSAA